MRLPEITHSQFLYLTFIRGRKFISGVELRAILRKHGQTFSGPSFYQFMARLEKAGYITSEYEQTMLDKQIFIQSLYTITTKGEKA